MSNVDYGPLNVELRAHETELLNDDFFRQLLSAKTIEEALKLLQGTPYEFIKDGSNIDRDLRSYMAGIFNRAFEMAPDKEVIEFASLDYSYHNLKVLFKDYYSDMDLEHLTIPVGRYSIEEFQKAVRTGMSQSLPQEYMTAITAVREYLESYNNINHIDILLDYNYLEHLYKLAQKIGHPLIIKMVEEFIDINSMIISLRLTKLNKPVSALLGMVPDVGAISSQQFVQWARDGYDTLSRNLMESSYRNILSGSLDSQQRINPIELEKIADNHWMSLIQAAKFESFGPLPIIAFLYAKETEVKNLRLILSGLDNQLPKESIEEALRLNYR